MGAYELAQSHACINKERAMRQRKLKRLWARLKQIVTMEKLSREELLMKSARRGIWSIQGGAQGRHLQLRAQSRQAAQARRRE